MRDIERHDEKLLEILGYRYGFNGMEKDDEVKGSGNSLDFGARMYDPRLGRWMSIDPYFQLYVPISPYAFALNIPTKLVDEDGNVVVDEEGNPVTVSVSKGEDGTYCADFVFAEGTSDDVKANFIENGGRAIKAAIQVQTGRESVQKAIESSENIHYIISPDEFVTTEKVEGGVKTVYRGGDTKIGRIYEKDDAGKPIGVKMFTQEVTIYEGTIDRVIKDMPSSDDQQGLTKEQRIGATYVHENEHATDPMEVANRKAGKSDLNEKNHDNVRAVEQKAVEEYRNLE